MIRPLLGLIAFILAALALTWGFSNPASAPGGSRAGVEITMTHVFGGCSDEFGTETDLSRATGECGIIQVLTNRFNAEHAGKIHVRTQTVEWSAYYDQLSAAMAAHHPPDVAVMHRSVLPAFAKRARLMPIGEELKEAGVDWSDLVPAAREAVTINGKIFGVPFDLHTLLWHVNLDLFTRAGLIDEKGQPKLPRSPSELLEHARQMKLKTGKRYFAIPSRVDPMPSWNFAQWVWQQGDELLAEDLKTPTFKTEAARRALGLMSTLYKEGHADAGDDYAGAEESFLSGRAAVILNGTWTVDSYSAAAKKPGSGLKRYFASHPPQIFASPASWSDSHVWVIPESAKRGPKQRGAALIFLKYLFDNSGVWARTGHLPVRQSVLSSQEFLSLPERKHFASVARTARGFQPIERQRTMQDILVQEINATWLQPRPVEESLEASQRAVGRALGGE